MSTYSVTETAPRELAGKIAADLRQFSLYYRQPRADEIRDYLEELEVLLQGGYLATYKFGFRRNGLWVLCYQYSVQRGVIAGGRAGGIRPSHDVRGASYLNYLTYSDSWWRLSDEGRRAVRAGLRINRTGMAEPALAAGGTWSLERTYGAGGIEIQRQVYAT